MTNEEINDQVGAIVEPDMCRHKWIKLFTEEEQVGSIFSNRTVCSECGDDLGADCLNIIVPFNYLSPDGIAKVRDWLEGQVLWDEFVHHVWSVIAQQVDRMEGMHQIANIYTKPEKFTKAFLAFIEYAKEKGLGE